MRKITLGEMLKRFRIEKGLEASQVCRGLCSPAAMSYFESGERMPDTLMFEYMMERMGVTPELFSVMISKDTYEYYEWKAKVCDAIENEMWGELEKLLIVKYSAQKKSKNRIEIQFYLYTKAICEGIKDKHAEATAMLKEAAQQTIPNIREIHKEKVLLSALEMHIMILYMFYGLKGNVLSIDETELLFESLESYIYNGKIDLNQKARVYSKLISVGLPILVDSMSEERQMELCKRAFELLRSSKTFHNIIELLELYVPLLQKHNSQEKDFYIKQREVFIDICSIQNKEIVSRPEQFVNSNPKYYMIHEFFSSKRKACGLTQEEVIEDICEPETYSRVETGKREPSRKNFQALVEKLDINWCYYRGELDTADLKVFELRRLQRLANIDGKRQLCLDILLEMEKRLDMTSVINIQYIKGNQYMAEYRMGKLSNEDAYIRMKDLLELTQKGKSDVSELVYYSQTELEILGNMAQILGKMGKFEEGIILIETVIKQMQNGIIHMKQQWNGFDYILRVLSGLYFDIGEYEMTIKITNYVKEENIRMKDGDCLAEQLDEIADCLEHIGKQHSEDYKKLYRYTYYVADFFFIDKIVGFAKEYYEKNFDEKVVWY